MARPTIELQVQNLEEVDKFLDAFSKRIEVDIYKGFYTYVSDNLVPRMKERLANATAPTSHSDLNSSLKSSGSSGGYGVPENDPKYSEWKKSKSNLPIKGNVSPRTLVATGLFIDYIGFNTGSSTFDNFVYSIGPQPGQRSATTPFRNDPHTPSEAHIKYVENTDVAEWIEDSKYAFLAKEYEDVIKDMQPLVKMIVTQTLKELIDQYFGAKKNG